MPGLVLYVPFLADGADLLFSALMVADIALYGALWLYAYRSGARMAWLDRCLAGYLRILFWPACALGRLFGMERRHVSRAYVQFLNRLVLLRNLRVSPERVLILAPHCLQWDRCPHKITRHISNCRRCGHCPIGAISVLAECSGCHFSVATGGTLARQIVQESRPQAIIAIACERDLVSGMQDVFPLPVLGLLNQRPNGPCFNTQVDVQALQQLLEMITGEHYECT